MRLDHIAYRVKDRFKTADFFVKCFNYRIAEDLPDGFKIQFDDGSNADCLVLLPSEHPVQKAPWLTEQYYGGEFVDYHMAPEIFISDGTSDSIVGKWVEERGGIGGIHHLAFQCDNVEKKMKEWTEKGYAEFATEKPLTCPGLVQVFTKPSELTGVIYEFIYREADGFCKENVKSLMESTKKFIMKEKQVYHGKIDSWQWIKALLGDYLLLVISFLPVYFWGWYGAIPSILLLGITQHRISILAHEGAHGMAFKNKKINYWITQIFTFWPLMIDMNRYKEFHWDHHRNTGDEKLDPEFYLKQNRYHLPITKTNLYGRFILDLFGASTPEFIHLIKYLSKKSNVFWAISWLVISFVACYYFGRIDFFVLFLLSKPTGFWAVFRLRIYLEHVDTDETHRVHLDQWQRFLFAPHNIWMHWEHHKHPQVPFYQLPDVREYYKEVPIVSFDTLIKTHNAKLKN